MVSVTTRHLCGPRLVAKSRNGLRAAFLATGAGLAAAAAVSSGAAAAPSTAAALPPATTVSAAATADPGKSADDNNVPFKVTVLRGSSATADTGATADPAGHSGSSDRFGVTVLRGSASPPEAPYPCASNDGVHSGFGCVPPPEPYPAYQPSEELGYLPYEDYGYWGYGWPFFGSAALPRRAFRHGFAHRRPVVAPHFAFRHPKFSFAQRFGGFGMHGRR